MRIVNKKNNASPENILYELMLYTEWSQDSDFVRSIYKSSDRNVPPAYRLWSPWDYFKKCESLLDEVANLKSSLLAWHFAIGEVGTVLAILQDTLLEIRTSRDDFFSVVGKATVARDNYQQWRLLSWSPDCSLLALASSHAAVHFYDLLGSNLFNIPHPGSYKEGQGWIPEHSLAGMFFINSRAKNQKWPYELILVDYGGNLRCFYVSPSEGFMEFHRYFFNKSGVSSVCWDATHNLLIVSSPPEHNYADLKTEPLGWGVSAWRLLNDHPYYRLAVPSPEDVARVESRKGLVSWLSSFYISPTFSVVFKMALSPDSQHLACLHSCGSISIWLLPSLRLHRVWGLKDQPNYDVEVESVKKKGRTYQLEDFLPVDISWWAEQKVIIARRNGAVSVCELNELRNLLGETPEFVHGEPRLSPASTQKGILVLECEMSHNQDGNSSSEEEESLVHKSSALVQSTVYLITDMERFQPKRKKAKIQKRTYRLLGIKSTTPEELFSRKIDAGEFEEALNLAEVYNLDTDRVYQSQWRNSPVSEETIIAYLSKISKKRWVFEECHERIPDTLSAAKKLIEFGLKITSFSALADMAAGNELDDEEINEFSEEDLTLNGQDLTSIPAEKLSDNQKCLILTRRTLLQFSDKLFTYEQMINSSEDVYDREMYDKFRRQPVALSAIELARQSDHHAVHLLLTFQGTDTLPYWLTTLTNFPETTSPASYKCLLPECSCDGEIFPWEQSKIRRDDWCENNHFDVLEPLEDLSEFNVPQPDGPLTTEVVAEWYRNRIYELELLSNMVDHPLELVKLARERNIKGLDGLYNELVTLDVLVYDVGMETLSLRDLEVMSPLQKAQALMDQSNEATFVENMRHRLVPFLQRCEKLQSLSRKHLLSQFLSDVSSNDLTNPLKMFEYCMEEPCNSLVQNVEELITLALDCIYAYSGTDQLGKAETILRTLPATPLGSIATALCEKVKAAENELQVAVILRRRGHALSPLYLHNHRANVETARALFKDLCTATGNRVPQATEADWSQLLQDLLQIQSLVFNCVPLELCYEVHAAGVLASGSGPVIRTAVRSLCCHSEERDRKPLSLQRSVTLVLLAATQYFDSAASLKDPNIGLAKTCLNLITEDNSEIEEEKDLISALQLLSEFKTSLLPMQIRLCTDRMRLVESCLSSRPTAYKEYHKLLSLAHKLRICGHDSRQREGIILVRVANISFEVKDYVYCAEICQQLMERRHTIGWESAQRLGQCEQFWDLPARQRLIAFALVHCPDNKVQELLDSRSELEYKRLQIYIREQAGTADSPSEDEEFMDAVTSPQTPSKQFMPQLSSTIQNTSKLLTQLTNSGFWKEKFLNKETTKEDSRRKGETQMTVQGFPEFYCSLHPHFHESVLSTDYSGSTADWKQYQLIQALLQASLLQQEKLPKQLIRDIDSVLVQYACLLLPEDSCVGLASLLALSRPEASDKCFSSLPLTPLTLQLAVYFLSLMQAVQHNQDAFLWTPDQVLAWATTHTDDTSDSSQLLTKALTQMKHLEQSKHVERLDCGVDVRRFAWDHQYKTDSILGLAMCEEWEKLRAALDLGAAHGVEDWEIVLSHVRCLLQSNSPLLSERLADNRLTQLLKNQAATVVQRLQENVLPTLNGVNHNQLINYYSVLQTVAPNTTVNELLPRDHIKLVKKVKATSHNIDYIRLILRPSEVLEALRPALRKETVAIVARLLKELLKTLPSLQATINIGHLYTDWCVAQFKTECLSPTCRNNLEQFAALQTYFQKMSVNDLFNFIKKTIFCHQSVTRLDMNVRLAMIDIVLRYCHQQPNLNNNTDVLKIQGLKVYLQQVWELDNISCKSLRNYLLRLDEACKDQEAISITIQTALLDASVPSHVLRNMAKLSNTRLLSSYITDMLHSLPSQSSLITTLLQRVEDCLAHGEKGDSWSIMIGPISEKVELPANVRKQASQISQRLGATYPEELEALRLKTEAVLRSPVQLAQVCDHNSRYLLFKQLLSQADTWDSLYTLSLLLSTWPDVDTSWYLELIESMAEVPNSETFLTLQKIFRKNAFEEEEVAHLVSRLEDNDYMFTISVCLTSDFKSLHLKAVEILRKLSNDTSLPKELAERIMEIGLSAELDGTPIFSKLTTLMESSSESNEQE